jgi:membrane protein required for colicin V production
MPIQALDIIVFLVMVLSGLLAMLRGLTQIMLDLVAWAGAALLTLLIYTHFRADVRAIIDPPMLADALLIGIVFILALVGSTVAVSYLLPHVQPQAAGKLDSMLGFPFGLLRGLVIVVIAYLIVGEFVERQNLPRWVTEARSLYLIEYTGDAIKSLMPDNPDWVFRKHGRPSSPAD